MYKRSGSFARIWFDGERDNILKDWKKSKVNGHLNVSFDEMISDDEIKFEPNDSAPSYGMNMNSQKDSIYQRLLKNVVQCVNSEGMTLKDAVNEQKNLFSTDPQNLGRLDQIEAYLVRNRDLIEGSESPSTLKRKDAFSWYLGPQEHDIYWPNLKSYLLNEKRWDKDTVDSIDDSSSKVISSLSFPGNAEFKTKGLVLGYVQSGKTANFTAVVSKAADVGFRLFIILSGLTNSLRDQTQERMDIDLVGRQPKDWLGWTDQERDIGEITFNPNALLDSNKKHLAIAKKNASRLKRLIGMLKRTEKSVLAKCPALIVDDECDQASVNSSGSPDNPSVINGLTRQLIDLLPRVAYIGYTATPFANLLIDPEWNDLYPDDFIVSLPRPNLYFGAERLFGRDPLDADNEMPDETGLDMIRHIDDSEIPFLQPPSRNERHDFAIGITASLREAVYYFLMATAVRNLRGQTNQHSSMLIHTTLYAAVHTNSQSAIQRLLRDTKAAIDSAEETVLNQMRSIWESELERLPPETFGHQVTPFDELIGEVGNVIDSTEVVVENSSSDQRLDFSESGKRYIVIGGNVLARGLTIEGLIVSYFIRTSTAYDSLMQMGRWFGYRVGFEDLPRIWMTPILASYFHDMATVESEIRNDIEVYAREKITPLDFAVPIRTHPDLAVTSANKMTGAVTRNISFSDKVEQTRKFHHQNSEWLKDNWDAGSDLVDSAIANGAELRKSDALCVLDNVDVESILGFFEKYSVHEAHVPIQSTRLMEYIRNQNGKDALKKWNVAVVGSRKGRQSEVPLGSCGPVNTVSRAKLELGADEFADIKALISRADIVKDIDVQPESDQWLDLKSARREYFEARGESTRPLLLLYAIDKDSAPLRSGGNRKTLGAVHDMLGMGVVFPIAENDQPLSYVSVAIEQFEQAEYEEEGDEQDNDGI